MEVLYIVFIILFGLIFGSFFCCAGYRIPNKISLVKSGSFCPNCKRKLKWYMNIPLFSFIFLKGKCGFCKNKISFIYPAVEVSTSILFLLAYLNFGFTYEFLISIIISSAFMVTIVSDFRYYYISDRVVVISLISVIIVKYIYFGVYETFYSILYGIILFLFMLFVKFLGNKMFKKESLGDGDIKLMGVIGTSLGILPSIFSLFLASVIGIVFALIIIKKNKNGIIPFGPFLLLGALIILYLSDPVNSLINYLIS